jgi:hypothetical protein
MPHRYSTFWLIFGNGAPLSPIWGWKDRAQRLPSWAPALLAALEASGCVQTAAVQCGRPIRVVYGVCAMVPPLRRAARLAIARYQATQLLPIGQLPEELPIGNSPIGESHVGKVGGTADFAGEVRDVREFAHPLEDLPMGAWLRLPHAEQAAVVVGYAGRTPRSVGAGDVRRRGGR